VLRRVKAHRFADAAVVAALLAAVSAIFDFDAFLVHRSGPVFWFAIFLLGIMLVCAFMAVLFSFTEQPKEIEVSEGSSISHVIHVARKQ
jgi:hypothetical protein